MNTLIERDLVYTTDLEKSEAFLRKNLEDAEKVFDSEEIVILDMNHNNFISSHISSITITKTYDEELNMSEITTLLMYCTLADFQLINVDLLHLAFLDNVSYTFDSVVVNVPEWLKNGTSIEYAYHYFKILKLSHRYTIEVRLGTQGSTNLQRYRLVPCDCSSFTNKSKHKYICVTNKSIIYIYLTNIQLRNQNNDDVYDEENSKETYDELHIIQMKIDGHEIDMNAIPAVEKFGIKQYTVDVAKYIDIKENIFKTLPMSWQQSHTTLTYAYAGFEPYDADANIVL